jgi:hypothetical protein
MKKKNFRSIESAPTTKITCVSCGLPLVAKNIDGAMKYYHWHIVDQDNGLYCCPNCDVTVVKTGNK